jgi:putative DNA primase/helicase
MPQPSAYPNLDRLAVIPDLPNEPPQLCLSPFSQINSQPVQWLWPDRIPLGKLTLLVGPPGIGKGLLALDLAARVTRGDPWPASTAPGSAGGLADHQAPSGSVVLLHADDDQADVVSHRLTAAGADLDKCVTLQHPPADTAPGSAGGFTPEQSLQDKLSVLKSALCTAADPRLIVIDPISAFVPTTAGRDNQSLSVLRSLLDLAKSHRLAIVAVAHSSSGPSIALGRPAITSSLLRAATTILGVIPDPKNHERRLLLPIKSNLAPRQPSLAFSITLDEAKSAPRLQWESEPLPATFNPLAPRLPPAERKYQDDENYFTVRLREELADGPKSRFKLQLFLPGSDQQQYRAAERLGVIKAKGGFEDGWVWMLPEHFPKWQTEQEAKRQQARQHRKERRRAASP